MNDASYWKHEIRAHLMESADAQRCTAGSRADAILAAARLVADSLARGGKLMLCGNGGSAADCQHLAAELVGRMNGLERPALAALALTTDTSALTALGNDFGYAEVFKRQVEGLGRPGDVLVAISTSGRSDNVLRAVAAASRLGMSTVGLTGEGGGPLADVVDINISVPSSDTQRIQEVHITIGHVICYLVERLLVEQKEKMVECLTGQTSG